MSTPKDKQRELRLRELEAEINREHKSRQPKANLAEPPLYNTRKHNPPQNSLQKFGRKIVKVAKFTGFVICGIAIIRAGFFIGMWITYLTMAGIVAAIGYQLFLKEDK